MIPANCSTASPPPRLADRSQRGGSRSSTVDGPASCLNSAGGPRLTPRQLTRRQQTRDEREYDGNERDDNDEHDINDNDNNGDGDEAGDGDDDDEDRDAATVMATASD